MGMFGLGNAPAVARQRAGPREGTASPLATAVAPQTSRPRSLPHHVLPAIRGFLARRRDLGASAPPRGPKTPSEGCQN